MASYGTRILRFSVRRFGRFCSHTSGSLTYLLTQSTASAGRMPIHNKPRQPMELYSNPYAEGPFGAHGDAKQSA
jgi:hypothetical protein